MTEPIAAQSRSVWRYSNTTPGFLVALVVASTMFGQLSGCTTLREIAALRQVAFTLDRVDEIELGGVRLDNIRNYDDLSFVELARLGAMLAREEMPLSFNLDIGALNPPDNKVNARLVRFQWTLFLEERETVSGVFNDEINLAPGTPETIPLRIELDLLEFFGSNLTELAELGLAIADQGGEPKNISITATPTIDTAVGPIRYPEPIRIVSRTFGD